VTGAICVATCAVLEGSVADGIAERPPGDERRIRIEHPTGVIDVALQTRGRGQELDVVRGGVRRTARKLMAGEVWVPAHLWEGR
jgi:4-oxalomesaconate tautomerase